MSLIKNLIQEPQKKAAEENSDDSADEKKSKPRPIVKSAVDLQRLKIEKLMKNPNKPVLLPERRQEKDYMQTVPTFVRNVMGSSAGAGSGEFHVYRHLRRKEYARQKTIQAKSIKEQLDDDYQNKLEANRRAAEEKTAKKRAKRLKKKNRAKKPRQALEFKAEEKVSEEDSEESEGDQVANQNDILGIQKESADTECDSTVTEKDLQMLDIQNAAHSAESADMDKMADLGETTKDQQTDMNAHEVTTPTESDRKNVENDLPTTDIQEVDNKVHSVEACKAGTDVHMDKEEHGNVSKY